MSSIPCDTCILFPMCMEQARNSNALICNLLEQWMNKEKRFWPQGFKEINDLFSPVKIEFVLVEESKNK